MPPPPPPNFKDAVKQIAEQLKLSNQLKVNQLAYNHQLRQQKAQLDAITKAEKERAAANRAALQGIKNLTATSLVAGGLLGKLLADTASHFNPASSIRFQRALADLAATIGEILAPSFELLIKAVEGFADWLANLSPATKEWINKLVQVILPLTIIATVAGGLVTIFSSVISVVATLVSALSSIISVVATVGSAIVGAMNPAVAIVLAIGAAIAGVIALIVKLKGKKKEPEGVKEVEDKSKEEQRERARSAQYPVKRFTSVLDPGQLFRQQSLQFSPNVTPKKDDTRVPELLGAILTYIREVGAKAQTQ